MSGSNCRCRVTRFRVLKSFSHIPPPLGSTGKYMSSLNSIGLQSLLMNRDKAGVTA